MFIQAAIEHNSQVICCSALLATNDGRHQGLITAMKAAGIRDSVKIMSAARRLRSPSATRLARTATRRTQRPRRSRRWSSAKPAKISNKKSVPVLGTLFLLLRLAFGVLRQLVEPAEPPAAGTRPASGRYALKRMRKVASGRKTPPARRSAPCPARGCRAGALRDPREGA